jgi:SAM-dependent methyltransferase
MHGAKPHPPDAAPERSAAPDDHSSHHGHHHRPLTGLYGLVAGLTMLGRGGRTRLVVDLAQIAPGERVLDVGCGPGAAVREAAKRGAVVTGVDPSPVMRKLARQLTRAQRGVTLLDGTAEALPLPDRAADVAWAVASAHHWEDPTAAFAELHRVLVPGGRLLVVERLVKEGARGHGAHGASPDVADRLVGHAEAAGFTGAAHTSHRSGSHHLVAITATNT